MNQEENLFFKMIYEVSDYAIIMLDSDGNVMNWNIGAQRIKGYQADEIVGKSFRNFYTDKDKAEGKPDELLQIAKSQGTARDEGWRKKKDGTYFWGSITITAIHDNQGAITGFSKVTRDLTERKNAENELIERSKELEKKNRELEQFAYIASHDLQEPLRTITCLHELLRANFIDTLDEKTIQVLDYINEAKQRMRSLIHGLLDYSRIGKESQLIDVDVNKLIRDVQVDLKLLIEDAQAEIIADELPVVSAFEIEIRQMFTNLITNAIKFRAAGQKPVIYISGKEKRGVWTFSVKDNGIGIPKNFHEKIFVIFQRLHSRETYEGTGIGLAHCHKIAQLHKGDIWVESEEGKGSTFYFTVDTHKLKSE